MKLSLRSLRRLVREALNPSLLKVHPLSPDEARRVEDWLDSLRWEVGDVLYFDVDSYVADVNEKFRNHTTAVNAVPVVVDSVPPDLAKGSLLCRISGLGRRVSSVGAVLDPPVDFHVLRTPRSGTSVRDRRVFNVIEAGDSNARYFTKLSSEAPDWRDGEGIMPEDWYSY